MSSHPINPGRSPEAPRPDPANPLLNPRPVPGHAPEEVPPRQPNELPAADLDPAPTPNAPARPPQHPLGPYEPQPRG